MAEDAFTLTQCTDLAVWDGFVESSPQGCVFACTRFLAALGQACEYYFVVENGTPVLGVPVLLRDGVPVATPFSYAQYLGPMFGAALETEPAHRRVPHKLRIMDFLLAQMSGRWPLISFTLHPAFDDLRAIQWFNYHAPEKGQFATRLSYTGRAPIGEGATETNFLERVRTVRRQEFRKAETLGFILEENGSVDELDRLHELTFSRQGIARPADDVVQMRAITQAAVEFQFGHCFVARSAEGQAASAVLFIHDRDTAYYLFGANDPDFRKTGAGSWLMIKAIQHAQSTGRKAVDFVGINSPNRGDFKTSFGGQPVPYFNVTWRRP